MIKKKACKAKKGNWSMYKRRGSLIVEGKETQAKIDKKKKEVKELEEKLRRLKNPWGYDKKPIVRW